MPYWLETAYKYLGLAEVKGPKHNPKIVEWWKRIRSAFRDDETAWCFTGETEVLTENGWVRFDELGDERVYQADESGGLSLTYAEKITKPYGGDVYEIAHRSIRLTCDIGHRWWGAWGKNPAHRFGTLDQITADGLSIPAVFSSCADNHYSDDQLALIAAFIADGKHRWSNGKNGGKPWSIEFEVSRQRKIDRLRDLRPDNEYTQKKAYGPTTKSPLTVLRFSYPDYFDACFCAYKSLSSDFIVSLSKRQALYFLKQYALFDGNNNDTKTIIYTSDEGNLQALLWIATLAGVHASVQKKATGGLSKKQAYCIAFSPLKKVRHLKKIHLKKQRFAGTLYCVRVPESRIVVRGPDSAPVVTGNCAAFVGGVLEEAAIRSSRSAAARSYLKWGIPLSGPARGAVVVFWRGKPTGPYGHVAFVAGKDKFGNIMVIGGNQGDLVSIAPFDPARIIGYRWPEGEPLPAAGWPLLPVIQSDGKASTNEA